MTRLICLDGEGVIWHGGKAVEGAQSIIDQFRNSGYRVVVITNNATRSIEQYVKRLNEGGFPGFTPSDVITSAAAVAEYFKKCGFANNQNRKVFAIGTAGFCQELRQNGITILTSADFDGSDIYEMNLDPSVCAVAVGNSEDFTYRHVAIATRFVIENDALLIAANNDPSYPHHRRVLVPGAYALAQCIACASERDAISFGKPSSTMLNALPGIEKVDIANSWMIGDRLSTDIKFAKNCGLKSILVLTGVSKAEEVSQLHKEDQPDFICPDLSSCLQTILKNQ